MTEKEIIQKIYEAIKLVDCMQYNPLVDFNYLRAKGAYDIIKNQVEHIEAENAELRARLGKAIEVPFVVLDKTTGKEADLGEIALHEEWAKSLVYCDMDGFAITQDGALLLLDECGKFEYCPSDRFEIVAETRLKELKEDI